MMIKEKLPVRFRHELKYIINQQDDFFLTFRLRKLFKHDRNVGLQGTYRVNSLYFDTPYDTALRQKTDGINRREKFRLRYYGKNTSVIRLEKKFKVNGLCGKYSENITKEQVKSLLSGNIDFLLECENPLFLEFYNKIKTQLLAPKTIVTYDREAFCYAPGNVRITIDRNLHSSIGNMEFLNLQRYDVPVSEGKVILEVKYDEFLPEFVSMAVNIPNRRASAYSKYAICRKYE